MPGTAPLNRGNRSPPPIHLPGSKIGKPLHMRIVRGFRECNKMARRTPSGVIGAFCDRIRKTSRYARRVDAASPRGVVRNNPSFSIGIDPRRPQTLPHRPANAPALVASSPPSPVGFDPAFAAVGNRGKRVYSGKPRDGAIQLLLGPRHYAHYARSCSPRSGLITTAPQVFSENTEKQFDKIR